MYFDIIKINCWINNDPSPLEINYHPLKGNPPFKEPLLIEGPLEVGPSLRSLFDHLFCLLLSNLSPYSSGMDLIIQLPSQIMIV